MILCLTIASALRWHDLEQVPPGVHYDEAANGILASDIGLQGERPIFISSYTGKEVLFFYPAGAIISLIGQSTFALRFTASLFGLLTIAATYWLGRELLADRRIAILAAALMAVSFWHILFSRLGFRAITQPLLQALMLAALLRGIKHNDKRWLTLSGLCLGLSAYTYLAVRVFPLLLLIGLLPLLIPSATRRQRLSQLALVIGVGGLILAPLVAYFVANPDAFWVRIGQVAPAGTNTPTLLQSYLKSLSMLFITGDPYWRFNLPGRALFNGLWGGFLLVGWLTPLWRWRKEWYDWQKSAILTLLIAPFIMILPTALATSEIVPSNLRAIGLIPFIFYLPAIGLITLLEQLAQHLRQPDNPLTTRLQTLKLLHGYEINYTPITLIVLISGAALVSQSYFADWATRTDVYYETDADLSAIADYLDTTNPADGAIFVAALHYRHPTLAFLSQQYDHIKWLPDSEALVIPAGTPATYLYPHNSPAPDWATPYLPQPSLIQTNATGKTAFTVYHTQPHTPTITLPHANFGHAIHLTEYATEPAPAGTHIPLTLHWQVTTPTAPPVIPFVHLEDQWGHRWSQIESNAYPAEQWQLGDTIIQRINIPIPAGTPPASTYQLRLGFFNPTTNERLPSLNQDGSYAGDSVYLPTTVLAGQPPTPLPTPPRGQAQQARPGLTLLGYQRASGPFNTGEPIPLSLWWHTTQPQPHLLIRLELIRSDNTGLRLLDTRPVQETYPFPNWATPSFVIDTVNPTIPASFPAGTYTLLLRLLDNDQSIHTSNLGLLTINQTTRLFQPPTPTTPLPATFGQDIHLLGYNLLPTENANTHTLTLIWQTLRQPTQDYTVFVHLLNPDGTCCAWQQDTMPQQNTYPTSRWIDNEIILDTYHIPPLPTSGTYPIEIGLYLPQNGLRLAITQPNIIDTPDALFLNPLIIP